MLENPHTFLMKAGSYTFGKFKHYSTKSLVLYFSYRDKAFCYLQRHRKHGQRRAISSFAARFSFHDLNSDNRYVVLLAFARAQPQRFADSVDYPVKVGAALTHDKLFQPRFI